MISNDKTNITIIFSYTTIFYSYFTNKFSLELRNIDLFNIIHCYSEFYITSKQVDVFKSEPHSV